MKLKPLLVEDHPDMRARVVSLLQRDFDVVGSVASGTAAVEAENKLKPDILILDVLLPIRMGSRSQNILRLRDAKRG
jgi:DNA-binding NarL/FixJ family response regulator